jgi:integrase
MMPRRGAELFQVDLNQIRTKVERDRAADGPEQLSVVEIKKLVHAGNEGQRILMLLALFTGMGQTELAVTRREEFELDAALFKHRRNKTSKSRQWWLPYELVTLLRDYFKKVQPTDGLAFRTRERRPLVTQDSDSVRQWFDGVRKTAGITRAGVTFYAFRRFLGDRAKRKGGSELRDAALAHAGHTVGDKHYSNFRDFAQVEELGRELYRDLRNVGVFDWPDDAQRRDAESTMAAV